jgi:hypothetical protein
MTGADFSDFLNSVGGNPSLKSLDYMARLTEEAVNQTHTDTTSTAETAIIPPPTPTDNTTVHNADATSEEEDRTVVWKTGDPSPADGPSQTSSEDNHDNNRYVK